MAKSISVIFPQISDTRFMTTVVENVLFVPNLETGVYFRIFIPDDIKEIEVVPPQCSFKEPSGGLKADEGLNGELESYEIWREGAVSNQHIFNKDNFPDKLIYKKHIDSVKNHPYDEWRLLIFRWKGGKYTATLYYDLKHCHETVKVSSVPC